MGVGGSGRSGHPVIATVNQFGSNTPELDPNNTRHARVGG